MSKEQAFIIWLVCSIFICRSNFFMVIKSAMMPPTISSSTTLRAAFIIPECSWDETPSDVSDINFSKELLPLILRSVEKRGGGISAFQAFTAENNVKGLNLLSIWYIYNIKLNDLE